MKFSEIIVQDNSYTSCSVINYTKNVAVKIKN